LQEQVQNILATIVRDGVARPLSDFIGNIFNGVNFITRTPEDLTFRNAQVQQFANVVRTVANVLLAVVAMVGGFNVIFRPYFGSTYHTAMEMVPRFVLGGILVNTANWWCAFAIQANNTLCGLFGSEGIAAILRSMTDAIGLSLVGGPIAAFPLIVAVAIYVVMFLLLVVQQVMRLGLIDVLLVLSPLAAICWVLPQTHGWARLWASVFLGTVFAQFVQVLTLVLGVNLMTASWVTSTMANGPAAALLQPLLGVGIVWLTLKVPSLMRGAGAGGNFAGSLVGSATGAAIGMGVRAALGGAAGAASASSGGTCRSASGAVASRS